MLGRPARRIRQADRQASDVKLRLMQAIQEVALTIPLGREPIARSLYPAVYPAVTQAEPRTRAEIAGFQRQISRAADDDSEGNPGNCRRPTLAHRSTFPLRYLQYSGSTRWYFSSDVVDG